MAADSHGNFVYSTVATAPSPASSGTTLTVATGDGSIFNAETAPYNCTVWPRGVQPLQTNAEIVRVTGVSGDVLTIVRNVSPPAAAIGETSNPYNRSILVGDQIALTLTDKVLRDAENPTRTTAAYTTGSLAAQARETGTVTLNKGWRVLKIQTSRAARVRLYCTTADRDADTTRVPGVDPTGDHGVLFDFVTTASILTWRLSPLVDGAQMSGSPTTSIPITVDNYDTVTGTVTVTFTYITTEA